jgi:hypothetical protein
VQKPYLPPSSQGLGSGEGWGRGRQRLAPERVAFLTLTPGHRAVDRVTFVDQRSSPGPSVAWHSELRVPNAPQSKRQLFPDVPIQATPLIIAPPNTPIRKLESSCRFSACGSTTVADGMGVARHRDGTEARVRANALGLLQDGQANPWKRSETRECACLASCFGLL